VAKKYHFDKIQADILGDMSTALTSDEKDRLGIAKRLLSMKIYQQLNDKKGLANSYYNLGLDYKYLGLPDSAEIYLLLSREESSFKFMKINFNLLF